MLLIYERDREVHVELSHSDKLNLISLFLTLGPKVFSCKRHKWKNRQMFTVYYFIILYQFHDLILYRES